MLLLKQKIFILQFAANNFLLSLSTKYNNKRLFRAMSILCQSNFSQQCRFDWTSLTKNFNLKGVANWISDVMFKLSIPSQDFLEHLSMNWGLLNEFTRRTTCQSSRSLAYSSTRLWLHFECLHCTFIKSVHVASVISKVAG